MPTTDELDVRLADLETAMADAQGKILKRATAGEVLALDTVRTLQKTSNDEEHADVATRLGKLERQAAVTNKRLMHAVELGDDDELAEDLTFAVAAQGVVLRSPDGSKFRLLVGDDGALSTEAVA